MDKNTTPNRERHGHHLDLADDTDELDLQPVGTRLTRPQAVGAAAVTDRDIAATAGEAEEDSAGEPPSNRTTGPEGDENRVEGRLEQLGSEETNSEEANDGKPQSATEQRRGSR